MLARHAPLRRSAGNGKTGSPPFRAGSTILTELNNECLVGIDDAIKLDAAALAPMVAIGDANFEAKTIQNLAQCADYTARYGIPTLGVTAVGKNLVRDARYLGLATASARKTVRRS